MIATTQVRYDNFKQTLRLSLVAARGTLTIGLRVDGGPDDANLLIRTDSGAQRMLRVRAAQSQHRADTWNLVGLMTAVVMQHKPLGKNAELPDRIYRVFERGVNQRRAGWVMLRVENSVPVSASLAQTL